MSLSPLNNLSNSYLQSVLGTTLQNSGLNNTVNNALSSLSTLTQSDGGQLSLFAQVLSTLQQLQQSNPAQYQQVTQQIATSLQTAAQTAQQNGNSTAANQLNQLATDFTNASQSGQLPNISDLSQAIHGHHHHGHGHSHGTPGTTDSDGDGTNTSSTSSAGSPNSVLSQLVSSLQVNTAQNDSTNPIAIIENTLANAGLSNSAGQ